MSESGKVIRDGLRLKCGCARSRDESEKVFGVRAVKDGDMAYCPKHGDVRLVSKAEYERSKGR